MRAQALAFAWELRQRHRVALVALAGYALVVVTLRLLVLGSDEPLTLDPPNGLAALLLVPITAAFFYLLAVFSFGLGGDVAARESMFPARLFTLPVTTRTLAGWPMLFGTTTVASLWLVTALCVRWSWGLELPLGWPALLAAVFLAWTQVLTWTGYGLPGLRIVANVLWLAALDAVVILAVHLRVPEPRLMALLAPQLPLAYLAACFVLARARRGDVPDWRGAFARKSGIGQVPRRRQFSSPASAQVWFEWRQEGRVLPALVGLLLPFELGLLYLARHEPPVLVELTLLGVLLTPPLMAGFSAATSGRADRGGGDRAGATLVATRPLTSAEIVAAKLRAALWSTLAAWLLVLVAVPLALVLTGTWPTVADGTRKVIEQLGRPRATAAALLGLAGLLASTWKQLVQTLYVGLAGRAWVVRTSVLVRLALLVIVWPLADSVVRNGRVQAALWDDWPWLLAVPVVLKVSAGAWVLSRLVRSRLFSDGSLLKGAALWSAAVFALYGVLVWLLCTPPLIPRYLPALVAILAVPLVRLCAAPLALAWSRHRGVEGRADPASSAVGIHSARTIAAVCALVGLPIALLAFEALSFEIRNRTNGTIVSSGEAREYLVHVPKSYDAAKPAALVISLHGAGGWPALQQDTSRWSALADRQGFIVAYPAGTAGHGPRFWNADRGKGLERDVKFIADLIDSLRASYNIDPTRVYADGLSNGGGMAFVLSCTLADRIAAVGMVASAQLLPFDWCAERHPVPMIAFHGTADRMVPYHGGRSWVAPEPFPDIPTFAADWARRNQCRRQPVEAAVAADVTRLEYEGCADDADVVLYTVEGAGHTWPGGGPLPEWLGGPNSFGVDATAATWAFFRGHPLRATR